MAEEKELGPLKMDPKGPIGWDVCPCGQHSYMQLGDKYCSGCGRKIEWAVPDRPAEAPDKGGR